MAVDEVAESMGNAWLEAAGELGIRVTAPHAISTSFGRATYVALLPDFGGKLGTVIVPIAGEHGVEQLAAKEQGVHFSQLAESYCSFDRDLFVATLNDWGWFGPEDAKPDWYTGEAWS
jgi:hypothetical protein